jgi:hypothetical protein
MTTTATQLAAALRDLEASYERIKPPGYPLSDYQKRARQALAAFEAQAATAAEPVAWLRDFWGPDCGPYYEIHKSADMTWRTKDGWTPLYAAPVAQAEPRKPLTDEQIEVMPVWEHFVGLWPETRREIVEAIEAAHGIKENP